MSVIIPYKEKEIYDNEGAFIKPDGEIIYTYGLHETFSSKYCNGDLYNSLYECIHPDSILSRDDSISLSEWFEYLKACCNYKGTIEEIDEYSSSQLTSEQLKLYKIWLDKYEFKGRNSLSDFMVYLLQFDKVETVMRKAITTTNSNPHIRFFNYYLMDWHIFEKPPMKYNNNTGLFEYDKDNWYLDKNKDKEAEDEIEEIKAKVLKKDRPLFFK